MKFILDDFDEPRAERLFVDRVEPRQVFWDSFAAAERGLEEPLVLCYYGVGGIGKSSLHDQLIKELQERRPAAKYISLDFDFVERREPYRVLNLLKKKLSDAWGFQFPVFDVACYTFLCRIGEDVDEKEVEALVSGSQMLNFLCDAASMVPGMSMVSGILKLVDEGVAVARNIFSDKKQLLRRMETTDIRLLREQLPAYFAADLRENLKKERQPFVFFLDTYEKLVNEFSGVGEPLQTDLWLRGPGGLIPRLPNTIWVIGGREKLKWPELDGAGQWEQVLKQYLLGTLGEADSEEFLTSAGVADRASRRQIYTLSGGLPVSLDLYVEQYLREGRIAEEIAPAALHERVVRYMSDTEKNVCYMLAFLGQWTQKQAVSAAQCAGISLPLSLYEKLCSFSFIMEEKDGVCHMMRQVAEVLRQNCPASLGREFTAALAAPVQEEPALQEADVSHTDSTAASLTEEEQHKEMLRAFDAAPEKYIRMALSGFEDERQCIDWLLNPDIGKRFNRMCRYMELDTFFAVLASIKEWAGQRFRGGVLELLLDAYNGIGLFYAQRPELGRNVLRVTLEELCGRADGNVLYTAAMFYFEAELGSMNYTDAVEIGIRVWNILKEQEDFRAADAAEMIAIAYEGMELEEESRLWHGRAEASAAGERDSWNEPEPKKTPDEIRLDALKQELDECLEAGEFSADDRASIEALLQEGRALTSKLYGAYSRELFSWCVDQGSAYRKAGDDESCIQAYAEAADVCAGCFGKTSGAYANMKALHLMMKVIDDLVKCDWTEYQEYSTQFGALHQILADRMGAQNSFTQTAKYYEEVLNVSGLTTAACLDKLNTLLESGHYAAQEEEYAQIVMMKELLDVVKEYAGEELVVTEAFAPGGAAQELFAESETQKLTAEQETQKLAAELEEQELSAEAEEQQEQSGEEVTVEEVIKDLMNTWSPRDLYTAYTGIPEKKLRNALKSYGEDPRGEYAPYVMALHDATVFGSGKEGILLLTSGVLFRSAGNSGGIELKNLLPFTVDGKNSLVLNAQGSLHVENFPAINAQSSAEVLNGILHLLQGQEEN